MRPVATMSRIGLLFLLPAMLMLGCSTAPKSEEARDKIVDDSQKTLQMFREVHPSVDTFLNGAYGYAVFPNVGKAGAGVGGAYGKGVVYEGKTAVGYCDLSQASIGLQLGGENFSELIAFQTKEALERFKTGNFAFSANASAVAVKSGVAAAVKYENGVAVFVHTKGGLMAQAAVGGQKFSYRPMSQ